MKKSWEEIKNEVINLGFEKPAIFEKNRNTFYEAFNWAQTYIATTVSPIYDEQIVTVEEHNADISKIENLITVERIIGPSGNDIKHTSLDKLNLLPDGDYTVKYKKFPTKVTDNNKDEYECEINYAYANIMPYLVAYRLWLDDDISKAVMYWNTFDDMKQQIQTNGFEIKVFEGWGI